MIFISNSNLTSNHKKWFNANIAQPLKGVVADVVQDIERFNIGNEAESAVLEAHYFSGYKGDLVLKTPSGKSSFSYDIMFIGKPINTPLTNKIFYCAIKDNQGDSYDNIQWIH